MPIRGGQYAPGAVKLVEEQAFDCFRRLVSVEAAVFNCELLCHCIGQFFHVIRHFYKSPDHRPKYPAALAVGVELRFKAIERVTSPCIQRFGPGMIVGVDLTLFLTCDSEKESAPRTYFFQSFPYFPNKGPKPRAGLSLSFSEPNQSSRGAN